MKQIMLQGQKSRPSKMIESDVKNALSITTYNWTDVSGLSWIFREDSMTNYA
ncbi:hypothetical protein [Nitrosopumilus piranensis]|uniref:Uncharacterized protein n=1 Tax=Nitrosopumilus piranensis TaxID=1582439 RepID=A0A0C5BXT1_9ARCH|nr:hypothetical protein [Nitrosopumilus piranensis]AJM93116.1 hypothetical protein NPIRD3C_1906 [Nitrosopumilus piranensis]